MLELMRAYKYRGERRLGAWFASQMTSLFPLAVDHLAWVPTTPERLRARGYDQSEVLARSLGHKTGVPVARVLTRDSGDHRQTERGVVDRAGGPRLNVRDRVRGTVVIVDDVMTTGASLHVAAEQCRRAGASRVIGLVAAATPRRAGPGSSRVRSWK